MPTEIQVKVVSRNLQDAIDESIARVYEHQVSEKPVFWKIVEISGEVGGIVGRPQLSLKLVIGD